VTRSSSSAAGFTLLEILVALVVFGLLVVGLTQGVHFGLRARTTQARIIAMSDSLDTTDRTLRNLIEQMSPGTSDQPTSMVGTSRSMSFTSNLPRWQGGLEEPQLTGTLLVDNAHRLLLRWVPREHVARFGANPRPTDIELVAGVDHIQIGYWRQQARGGDWVGSWNGPGLPSLVRIGIVFVAGDRRHWPEIIVAPMRQPIDAQG
jgi:general secretion pathway protein J